MTDPLGLAASAAAKIGSAAIASRYRPNGQQRVGGREERRQVYTRFQEAVVGYVMQIRDSRVTPEIMNLGPADRKPYMDALLGATTEFAQALYELRLVGNPDPIDAAETVRQAVTDSFEAAAARREPLTEAEMAGYADAMHGFTSACRVDLWYQPRWWQPWRSGWRDALRTHRTRRRAAKKANPRMPSAGNGHDVVFGSPTVGGISNTVSGTVHGKVIQHGSLGGIVFPKPEVEGEKAE